MEENIKKAIAFILLGCFVISLTATSATATTYTEGMGLKDPNNPNSIDDHNVIMKYQKTLVALGYLNDDYATGYYGPETTRAVRQFQIDYKVTPVTGDIGGITHKKMYNSPTIRHPVRSLKSAWSWYNNEATFNTVVQKGEVIKKAVPVDVNVNVNANI